MERDSDLISILHVDDDPDFADLTADMLERHDSRFSVTTETSVSDGLARLADQTFDCIVSDHDMPCRNGIEFLQTVRQQYGDLPYILFTGKGSEAVASDAISAGVTDYLQKERGADQYRILANRIQNTVERTRAQRDREYMRARMELALEHTDSLIHEIDLDTDQVTIHGQFDKFFDFPPEDVPTWQDQLDHGVHPDDQDQFQSFYEAIVNGDRDSGTFEYRTRPANDDVRWIRDTVSVDYQSRRVLGLAQDITEYKAREKEREQIIDRVTDAIVKVDADWRFTLVNEQAEAHYEMCEADLLQENLWDVFPDTQGTRFEEEYRRVMDTRERTAFVEYFAGLDGWFDVRVYPENDGGLSFYFREASTRLDSKHGFEERQLIDQALSTLNDVLYVIGPDGNFRWWNDRVPPITGYTGEELVNMDVLDVFPEDEHERIEAAIDETLTAGSAVVEAEFLTADGDRIPYEFSGDLVTDDDGNHLGLVGIGREITERRQRENRLEALNETGQKLIAADTRESVAEIGVASACDILGLDANGISLYDEERAALVPVAHTEAGRELIPNPPPTLGMESIAWRVFKRGESLAIDDIHDQPDVYDPATSIQSELFLPIDEYGILIASSTDPDAFDEQDVVLGTILADTIATALNQIEHTEQLSAQKQELRRQNDRLEEFTSVVSHDLRSPLQVATGHVELAKCECDSDHHDDALQALDRMNTLIDDLLALANEGEEIGKQEIVALDALVQDCWQSVETAEATLITELDTTLTADRSRLQQLLENLMRNAIEHGGTDVTVTVGELNDGFFVEDDGPGIPEEHSTSVFNTGYSTSDNGTGFGLSIVKQVVDAHDWCIQLVQGAEGTRFEITNIEFEG